MTEQVQATTGKGRKKLLWATVAIVVIAGAGLAGYKFTLENAITSQIEKRGGKAASVQADFMGNIHLKDVVLPLKNGQDLRIASFDGRPQFLFLTGRANATGISTEISGFKITIPQVNIDDANFNRQMLEEAFGGNSGLTPAQRVERFSAKQVNLSEVQLEQTVNASKQNTVYKNISLNDIQKGQIGSFKIDSTIFDLVVAMPKEDGKVANETISGTIGVSEGKDVDAAFATRLYTEKAGPDDKEAKQVHGAYTSKNISFKLPDASVSVDEVKSSGFTMRMANEPLLEMFNKFSSIEDPDAMTEEQQRELFRRLISLYETFGKGDGEMTGLKITPNDATLPAGGIASVKMSIIDQAMDVSFKGFNFGTDADYFKMDEFSWTGFSYGSTLEAGKKLLDLPADQMESFPFSTLMPEIGTFRMSGLDVDMPVVEPKLDQVAPEETETDETPTTITPPASEDHGEVAPSEEATDTGVAEAAPTTEGQAAGAVTAAEEAAKEAEKAAKEAVEAAEAGTHQHQVPSDDTAAQDATGSDTAPTVDSTETEEPAEEGVVEATPETPAAPVLPSRVKLKIKNYELAAIKPINGIPTDIRISYDGLDLPIPADANEEAFVKLREIGLDRLQLSSNTHILWEEASQSLLFKDISVKGENLGSVALSGSMGGMSKDFFSGDKVLMQVAALGLKAKDVNLRIEDKGLISKALKIAAAENGASEEEMRQGLVMAAAMMAQGFAPNNAQVQEAAEAFSKFLAKPNIFTLSITSKNEKGLGALEMVAASQNPLALLEKVNIKATAE